MFLSPYGGNDFPNCVYACDGGVLECGWVEEGNGGVHVSRSETFFFSFHIHSVSATIIYSSGTLINYERYDTNRNKIEAISVAVGCQYERPSRGGQQKNTHTHTHTHTHNAQEACGLLFDLFY